MKRLAPTSAPPQSSWHVFWCRALLVLAACSTGACIPDVTIQSDEGHTEAGVTDNSPQSEAGAGAESMDAGGTPNEEGMLGDTGATDTGSSDAGSSSNQDDVGDALADGTPDAGGAAGDDPVEATLKTLNVDTQVSPRVDQNGEPLPDSYTPLRSRKTLRQKSELLLSGVPFDTEDSTVNLLQFNRVSPDGTGEMTPLPTNPLPEDWQASPVSATTAGDLDGDGFDEMVFLWWDATEGTLNLQTVDDLEAQFRASEIDTLGMANPSELGVIAADLQGSGSDSLVMSVVEDGVATLVVLEGNMSDGYSRLGGASREFQPSGNGSLSLELAAGQLDRDAASELVLVTNDSTDPGLSNYYVLDDANEDLTELTSGLVSARIDNASVDARKATVALGDLDGDSLDEILLAGLTGVLSERCDPVDQMHFVLDDAAGDFSLLGAATSSVPVSPGCEVTGNLGWTDHIWAGMLNIDTDEARELHVNGKVFDDFRNAEPFTPMEQDGVVFEVPGDELFRGAANNSRPQIGRRNAKLIVGDVTDDGFEDIIVYTPTQEKLGDDEYLKHHLQVWGFDPQTGNWGLKYWKTLAGYPQVNTSNTDAPPLGLLALNVDADSTVVKYTGTHRVIFTEPVVHAALAAPPCWDDGTQETDPCRTSWGKGSSVGADASISHTISARKHMGWEGGVDLPFGEVGVEFEETVGVSLTSEASLGYELTSTITYQTGAMEDTVVATVVPYDQYVYTILSHSEYPELVGQEVVVSLPRRPRTIQVERGFFNRSLASGATPIDDAVLRHEIGNPRSYPSEAEARSQTSLRVGPVSVGASTGNTDVEISESVSAGFRSAISVSYETTLKATSGSYMSGYSIGDSITASLGVSVGSTTTFAGSVGDIHPDEFTSDKAYGYGMFVYLDDIAGQERPFQVINYWVE